MKNKVKFLVVFLLIILLLISNYYYISFPTIFDTFTYLLVNETFNTEKNIKIAIHYIPINLIFGNIDSILLNTILTYIGFIVFLIISILLKKELFGDNKRSTLVYFTIFGIFLFGSYRFFLGGFMQILIFIGIILSLYLQIKYENSKKNKYIIINYIYLFFLATINDFGIFLFIFNIIYNFKFLLKNKIIVFLFILGIITWGTIFYLVKNNIFYIEYPTDSKLKLLYNIFLNPFIWGPGEDFFNEFKLLFGGELLSYIFIALLILGGYFYKGKGKIYIIGFLIFYSVVLLLLPKAPSFNRYMSYFYPFVAIIIVSFLINKLKNYKIILVGVVSLLFVSQINAEKINSSFVDWNTNGRYGLEYKIGKDYICKKYSDKKIYGYYSTAFILGYISGGCNKSNLFFIKDDFYYGINPIETITKNKIDLFFYSKLTENRFDYDEYLMEYLKDEDISFENLLEKDKLTELFGKYDGSIWRVSLYKINYNKEYRLNEIIVGDRNFTITSNMQKFYLYLKGNSLDDIHGVININTNQYIDLKLLIPYNESDWSTFIIPININQVPPGTYKLIKNRNEFIKKINFFYKN